MVMQYTGHVIQTETRDKYTALSLVGVLLHIYEFWYKRIVFATNYDFLITISLEPNVTDLRYFKL